MEFFTAVFIAMAVGGVIVSVVRQASQWLNRKSSLDYQLVEIQHWGKTTFPTGTSASVAEHIHREAKELKADPLDQSEAADIFILLCHWSRLSGVDLGAAVKNKMEINYTRRWKNPDEDGVIEHAE